MFEAAQKAIGHHQLLAAAGGQQASLDQQRQHLQRWSHLQGDIAPATDQLKNLGDKLDFPNPAGAELDVIGLVLAQHFAANLCVQVAHGVDCAEIEIFSVDEGSNDLSQHLDPFTLAVFTGVHHPRLDPGVALPFTPLRDQIVFQRNERADQRPGIAVRTQAHVNAEHLPVTGDFVERGNQPLAEAGEEVMHFDTSPAVRCPGRFLYLGINEDQVDIGRNVQLAPAELAHADHHQPLWLAVVVERFTKIFHQLAVQEGQRVVDAEIGQQGHRFDDLFQRRQSGQIAHDQAGHDALAQTAQHLFQLCIVAQ